MRYSDKIKDYFLSLPEGGVVSANELYRKHFTKMSQSSFFKALERLSNSGFLVRVSKGMYALNKSDDLSNEEKEIAADAEILNYYFGEDNNCGMYIGYHLYNKYGITEYSDGKTELYSNVLKTKTCRVGNIYIHRTDIELNYDNTRIIEALEILKNYDCIEGLNKVRFARYARQFALGYNDEAAVYVIKNMHYKKCTIAFMKKIAEMYKAEHTLDQFLSAASKYKVPPVQRVAR